MNASQTLHPTDQTLSAYGLGKLDDASAESVNKHVESCFDCQRRVAELSSDSFLGRLRGAQGRPDSPAPIMSSTDGLSMLAAGPGSPAPPPASTLPPGLADHPDYEITRELGRGGMGVVYLAQNKIMGRTEVLKVVGGHLINRRGVVDRFLAEIRNAARLRHPNIVTAYSVLRVGDSLVLAMEHVEGLDLAKMVQARGPLPVAQACNYVHQAALGLQHAHEQGMVHRDIKPSNLMLTRQGNRAFIKVLDFGLAKVQSEGSVDGGLTHEGQMLGTPDYIAPEQISDARRADTRADIYSLGCTLYYLLTGGPPFQGTSLYDILQAHHSMDAKPLNLARPEVPVELAALVAKMMAKEPERRFQTPKEVAQALTPFFKKGSVAFTGSKPEFSQAGRPDAKQATAGPGFAATRPAAESAPAPGPSVRKPATTASPDALWESLVELRETERSQDKTPVNASPRRPRWLWPIAAIGLMLLGFVAVWGVVMKIWTPEGIIVLEDLPDQAMVLVDGKKATVHWPDGGGPAEITVAPGDHEVQVKKDGFTALGQKVTLEGGGRKMLTARLEPLEFLPSNKGDADNGVPRSEIDKRLLPPVDRGVAMTTPASPPIGVANPNANPTIHLNDRIGKAEGAAHFGQDVKETWIFLSYESDGRKNTKAELEDLLVIWDGDKFATKRGGTVEQAGIRKLYPTKTPKEIDVNIKEGIGKGITMLGIYEQEGDTLQLCFDPTGKMRPTEFKSEPGSGLNLIVFGRTNSKPDVDFRAGKVDGAGRARNEPVQRRENGAPRSPSRTAQVISGSWQVEGNELVQNDEAGTILLGDKELSSYDLKFQGQIVAGKEGFVALFHRTSDDNVRFFHVGELDGKRADLGFLHQGKEGGKAKPTSTVKGRWYHVLVKVRGAESWCFLDGQELFHDIDDRFSQGRVGLATWDASARFREISITSPEGNVLWSGLPKFPGD